MSRVVADIFVIPVESVPVVALDEVSDLRFANSRMIPKASTLRSLPWATDGEFKVGEFLCEISWMPSFRNGAPQAACPRYLARRQLRRLDELGLRLYSTHEAEFIVLNRSDLKPIFGGPQHSEIYTTQLLAQFEKFLYRTEKMLSASGVDIGKLHIEYAPGQLEFVPQPQYGIESADTMFRLRESVKEICQQKGWLATFMPQVSVTVVTAICRCHDRIVSQGIPLVTPRKFCFFYSSCMPRFDFGSLVGLLACTDDIQWLSTIVAVNLYLQKHGSIAKGVPPLMINTGRMLMKFITHCNTKLA